MLLITYITGQFVCDLFLKIKRAIECSKSSLCVYGEVAGRHDLCDSTGNNFLLSFS